MKSFANGISPLVRTFKVKYRGEITSTRNKLYHATRLSFSSKAINIDNDVRCFLAQEPSSTCTGSSSSGAGVGVGYYERPTPIVFVSGEGLSPAVWESAVKYFSSRGYSGFAMPLPHDTTTADETADRIGDIVAANGLTTPVIVAHSLSTYVVQKFLESYSPSAIVLINPIPRIPTATCDKLTVKKGDYFTLDADQRRLYSTGKAYENLLVNLKDPKSALEVEPGAVPILVVCTSADFSSGMITPEEVDDLLFFHGLDRSSLRILENWNTRTPMLKSSSENLEKLHSQLFEWIDNNA